MTPGSEQSREGNFTMATLKASVCPVPSGGLRGQPPVPGVADATKNPFLISPTPGLPFH